MVQYRRFALSNVTIGPLMASINRTIVLIALHALFADHRLDLKHMFGGRM
jgi:hypothetical protein